MVRVTPLASAALFSLAAIEVVIAKSQQHLGYSSGFLNTCNQIATSISNASVVYYPPSSQYYADIAHWSESSTVQSACSVEPGTAQDVAVILRICGVMRTPFAVKGGGHATNPGFSSTTGVQIAMTRFNQVVVDKTASLVEVGAGLIWDDVYTKLDGTGLNVVGGRVSGVGVAGFTLGGGYSWKTNQYGLTIDNIESFELVLPNGTIQTVTSQNEDLWFGLRGGFNNFGIVTKFVLQAHPQGDVWGGFIILPTLYFNEVNAAILKFQREVTDLKAAVLPTYNTVRDVTTIEVLMFYDGPERPPGIFDDFFEFLEIPVIETSATFLEFLKILPSSDPFAGPRAYFSTVSVFQYSTSLLNVIVNETIFWGDVLSKMDEGGAVSYDMEPFDSGLFSHSNISSAYPPDRSRALFPTNLYFAWTSSSKDTEVAAAILQSTNTIRSAANAEGQNITDVALYGNYALFETPVDALYGANLPRLKSIQSKVDPNNVMALAGGFKF
ncbi:FAD-binding domain-containing protein [Russula aff. rugulosa BPL654]|nr:FAD-binding domain-containing protein [Russula aff. rugulosa BPL654]